MYKQIHIAICRFQIISRVDLLKKSTFFYHYFNYSVKLEFEWYDIITLNSFTRYAHTYFPNFLNQSENRKYNLISVWFNNIRRRCLYVKTIFRLIRPNWNCYNDWAYTFPRGWKASASWGSINGPWDPSNITALSCFGVKWVLNLSPIMPRGGILSEQSMHYFT